MSRYHYEFISKIVKVIVNFAVKQILKKEPVFILGSYFNRGPVWVCFSKLACAIATVVFTVDDKFQETKGKGQDNILNNFRGSSNIAH